MFQPGQKVNSSVFVSRRLADVEISVVCEKGSLEHEYF